jgi:hypothetical protein
MAPAGQKSRIRSIHRLKVGTTCSPSCSLESLLASVQMKVSTTKEDNYGQYSS